MKLKDLKAAVDKAVEYAGNTDPKVEIWIGDKKCYEIGRIGQYGVVPDLVVMVGKKIYDRERDG